MENNVAAYNSFISFYSTYTEAELEINTIITWDVTYIYILLSAISFIKLCLFKFLHKNSIDSPQTFFYELLIAFFAY